MKIDHIALFVNDLPAARDFFVKYFNGRSNSGYHNEKTGFRSFFVTFDDGMRIELMNRPDISGDSDKTARTGYAHIAFSLGSKEAVDHLTARLRTDGYDVLSGPRTTGDGYYESCILGLEGNLVELTV